MLNNLQIFILAIFNQFEPMNFINNLKYIGIGMLGIFLVIGIIMCFIYILGLFSKKKSKKNKENK